MPGAEPERHASVAEIRSGIEHTCGRLDETVAAPANIGRSQTATKEPLAVVASVAGVTVVGLVWWRRRRRG